VCVRVNYKVEENFHEVLVYMLSCIYAYICCYVRYCPLIISRFYY